MTVTAAPVRYEVEKFEDQRIDCWSKLEPGAGADRGSKDRVGLYNRLLRRIQRAQTGIYQTPTGGKRHVFFDRTGTKHVMEREEVSHSMRVPGGRSLMSWVRVVVLDEILLNPQDGSLERRTQRWVIERNGSPHSEVIGRAFLEGLDILESGPSMRVLYRRQGNCLARHEMILTDDPARPGRARVRPQSLNGSAFAGADLNLELERRAAGTLRR